MAIANFCWERAAMLTDPVELQIERLGRRGEGVASFEGRAVYVPYALPGETVTVEIDGERGRVDEVVSPGRTAWTRSAPITGPAGVAPCRPWRRCPTERGNATS